MKKKYSTIRREGRDDDNMWEVEKKTLQMKGGNEVNNQGKKKKTGRREAKRKIC